MKPSATMLSLVLALAPGKRREMIWRFTRSGQVDLACLQPGHCDAGMKGQVAVAAAGAKGADRH